MLQYVVKGLFPSLILSLSACAPIKFKAVEPIVISTLPSAPIRFKSIELIFTPPCNYVELSELPNEAAIPPEYREQVAFVKDVRKFGIEQLGLRRCTQQYTTFKSDQHARTLYRLFVTKDMVLPDTWGEVSTPFENNTVFREDVKAMYFTSYVDTLEDELEYYKQKLYDVYSRNTTNYDPRDSKDGCSITPSFFNYTPEQQVHLILHEICHDTIEEWIRTGSPAEVEEPFCVLVGYAGTVEYLKTRKGTDSQEYKDALQSFMGYEEEAVKVTGWYKRLQGLYRSEKSEAQKLKERQNIFAEAKKFMNEEVNNARLWDKFPYVEHYPLMLQLYNSRNNDILTTLEVIKDCPEDKKKALQYIQERIEK